MAMILRVMFRYGVLFLSSLLWAQGSVTATEPSLQVCGPNGTVSVTVFNTGSSPLTDVQLAVQMPPGVQYVPGTVSPGTVTEISTTPANQPVFGVPDLPSNSNMPITFQVRATCDVIPFLADETNEVKNTYTLTWSGGGSASYTSKALCSPSQQKDCLRIVCVIMRFGAEKKRVLGVLWLPWPLKTYTLKMALS